MEAASIAIFGLIYLVIVCVLLGLWIYGFVLFVKVARRGIKALDIYIDGKSNNNNNNNKRLPDIYIDENSN